MLDLHTFTIRRDEQPGQRFDRSYYAHFTLPEPLDCHLFGHKPQWVPLPAIKTGYVECRRCRRRPVVPAHSHRHGRVLDVPVEDVETTVRFMAMGEGSALRWTTNRAECGVQVVGPPANFGVSFRLGSPGSETPIDFHVSIPGLGGIYAGLDGIGRRLAARFNPDHSREVSLAVHDGAIWWRLWRDPMGGSRRDDPQRWRESCWHPLDTLLGRATVTSEVLATRDTVIPMPEGEYRARVKLERYTRTRPRGRTEITYTAWCDAPDCVPTGRRKYGDDDGLCGCGVAVPPAQIQEVSAWVGLAVANFVHKALSDRARYRTVHWRPAREETPT